MRLIYSAAAAADWSWASAFKLCFDSGLQCRRHLTPPEQHQTCPTQHAPLHRRHQYSGFMQSRKKRASPWPRTKAGTNIFNSLILLHFDGKHSSLKKAPQFGTTIALKEMLKTRKDGRHHSRQHYPCFHFLPTHPRYFKNKKIPPPPRHPATSRLVCLRSARPSLFLQRLRCLQVILETHLPQRFRLAQRPRSSPFETEQRYIMHTLSCGDGHAEEIMGRWRQCAGIEDGDAQRHI